ncbi:BglII/BstYI family type II restriction endonuclease [Fontisphaera persica]|uniref:BglII/BstYI family type II restriction endonuclease n=1 Tax=Fontisphaera persica TaxID=2974023 RepID=UPI0024BF428E|nr:BglII/BstYI family type II restriction endonuclease [Fontisphaera persica]WCJ58090.1 BglII/BstYI family type II restriction endonuclease [Fontisphaera persica]
MNGEEYIRFHHQALYNEIINLIGQVDAGKCYQKKSREKSMPGKKLISPIALNKRFRELFIEVGWKEYRYEYYVTTDRKDLPFLLSRSLSEQRDYLEKKGINRPIKSLKQIDFVKNGIAVEVQFGKYAFVAFDLFVKHLLLYTGGAINVGVEILPMKEMLEDPNGGRRMSTGIAYFEGEIYNLLRHGRSSPPVPLFIIGIAP